MDNIRVEQYEMRWVDASKEDGLSWINVGFLDTREQYDVWSKGLEDNDPMWLDFDQNVFYWVYGFNNESIEDLYPENSNQDFYIIPDREEN